MAGPAETTELKRTPLYDLHVRLGARMVPFAGYDMPVQYPSGIIKEHLQTRTAAGLFDVSHMGQIALRPRSGRVEDAETLMTRACDTASDLGLFSEEYDPGDRLDTWLNDFEDGQGGNSKLEEYGLYREAPSATPNWVHLTTRPPHSGKRTFQP